MISQKNESEDNTKSKIENLNKNLQDLLSQLNFLKAEKINLNEKIKILE